MKVRDAHGNNVELLTEQAGEAVVPVHARRGRRIVASGTKQDAGFIDDDPRMLKVAFEHVHIAVEYESLDVRFTIDGHDVIVRAGEVLSEAYRGQALAYTLTAEGSAMRRETMAYNEAHADEDDFTPHEVPGADFRFVLSV